MNTMQVCQSIFLKVYLIDVNEMDDNFACLTCSDNDFILESTRQKLGGIDIKKFERMVNINGFNYEEFIIRFI
jgi:hypothetical protein